MPEEKRVNKVAREIGKEFRAGEESISLDQPLPEELKDNQSGEVKPLALPKLEIKNPTSTEGQNNPSEKTDKKSKGGEDATDSDDGLVGGYTPSDLIEAPVKPPKPTKTEGAEATSNRAVVLFVGAGLLVCFIGLILLILSNLLLGFVVLLVGALIIIFGVFAPVKP